MSQVTIEFQDQNRYDMWLEAIKSLSGVRIDSRGYDCIHLETDDELVLQAISMAFDLGAKKKY